MHLTASAANIERHPGAGISGTATAAAAPAPAASASAPSLGLSVRVAPRRLPPAPLTVMMLVAVHVTIARVTAAAAAVLVGLMMALVCPTNVRPLVTGNDFSVVDDRRRIGAAFFGPRDQGVACISPDNPDLWNGFLRSAPGAFYFSCELVLAEALRRGGFFPVVTPTAVVAFPSLAPPGAAAAAVMLASPAISRAFAPSLAFKARRDSSNSRRTRSGGNYIVLVDAARVCAAIATAAAASVSIAASTTTGGGIGVRLILRGAVVVGTCAGQLALLVGVAAAGTTAACCTVFLPVLFFRRGKGARLLCARAFAFAGGLALFSPLVRGREGQVAVLVRVRRGG